MKKLLNFLIAKTHGEVSKGNGCDGSFINLKFRVCPLSAHGLIAHLHHQVPESVVGKSPLPQELWRMGHPGYQFTFPRFTHLSSGAKGKMNS